MTRAGVSLGSLAIVVFAACGSSDDGGLTGGGSSGRAGAATGGTAGSATAGSGAMDASTAGGTGGTAGPAGTGGEAAGGASGAAGMTVGGTGGAPDAAAGTAGSAGASGAAGGSGASGSSGHGVLCGLDVCADECCSSETYGEYCVEPNKPCECEGVLCRKTEIECDGPEDCPTDEVCCLEDGVLDLRVRCRSSCDNSATEDRDEVCHPFQTCQAAGEVCLPDPRLPPGYLTCNPP